MGIFFLISKCEFIFYYCLAIIKPFLLTFIFIFLWLENLIDITCLGEYLSF